MAGILVARTKVMIDYLKELINLPDIWRLLGHHGCNENGIRELWMQGYPFCSNRGMFHVSPTQWVLHSAAGQGFVTACLTVFLCKPPYCLLRQMQTCLPGFWGFMWSSFPSSSGAGFFPWSPSSNINLIHDCALPMLVFFARNTIFPAPVVILEIQPCLHFVKHLLLPSSNLYFITYIIILPTNCSMCFLLAII